MALVDDGHKRCVCGQTNCTSKHYTGLDPKRPIPRKAGPGWDEEKAEKGPPRDKALGSDRDKLAQPDSRKKRLRTGPPATDVSDADA